MPFAPSWKSRRTKASKVSVRPMVATDRSACRKSAEPKLIGHSKQHSPRFPFSRPYRRGLLNDTRRRSVTESATFPNKVSRSTQMTSPRQFLNQTLGSAPFHHRQMTLLIIHPSRTSALSAHPAKHARITCNGLVMSR